MKRKDGHQRGNVLVAVLVAAFLILGLGLGLLSQAKLEHGISRRAADWESAFYAAWSGVEHALGEMNTRFPDYVGRPADQIVLVVAETPIGNGNYSVHVKSLGSNRYQVLSTGRSRSETRTIAATLAFRNASAAYYHIWGSEYYKIGGNSIIQGDLYSADEIYLDGWTHVVRDAQGVGGNVAARNKVTLGGNVIVDGDVTATVVEMNGTPTVKGTIHTGFGPEITMPEINLNGLRAMSPAWLDPADPSVPFTLDCTKTTGRHGACDGGYYLHRGDLTVYGEFTGHTAIGVEGAITGAARQITINKDLKKKRHPATGQPEDPDTLVAIVSDGTSNLTLRGGLEVEALLYTTDHRVDLPGSVTVRGAIIAHKVDNNGNLLFEMDPKFGDLIPGLPGVRLTVIEWHEQ